MNKKNLVFNAFALTAASLILRAAGMFFRIYLSDQVGAEGMGLHQLISSVYFLSIHLASGGIGVAVTRLVAERPVQDGKSALDVVKTALVFSLSTSTAVAAVLFFGAESIAQLWLGDSRATVSIQILAPSLPFIAASACFRGYLTARERVLRTAAAQIFEQIIRMGITIAVLPFLKRQGLEWGCAAIMVGTTISEMASCLFLLIVGRMGRHSSQTREQGVLREILSVSLPVTARSCSRSVLSAMENTMIPKGLAKYGVSSQQSLAQYGMLKGMALPVLFFPSSFITSISSLLVSELAMEHSARGWKGGQSEQARDLTRQVLRYTLLFSVFVAGLFLFFSQEIGVAFYKEPAVGSMVRILAPLVPLMYLESIVDGMLTALDEQISVMKYNMIDSVGRLFLVMLLLPRFGMNGFLGMMYLSNLFTSLMCIHKLLKVTAIEVPIWEWIGKPMLSTAVAGFTVMALAKGLLAGTMPEFALLAVECLISGGIYGVCLLLLGAVTVEEFVVPLRRILWGRRSIAR